MQDVPRIVERAAQPYVAVRRAVSMPFGDAVPGIMDTLFHELEAQEIQSVGPVFFKYNLIRMPDLEIEVGVPVAEGTEPGGGLAGGVLPAGRYVRSVHLGHYDELVEATGRVIDWASRNGHEWDSTMTPEGERFASRLETYTNGPDEEPDPGKWETIIEIKVRD